ncbi:MAG: pantetheine-phosphate adenylyltransferase [Deltaproteobacteria bacterium]|uniref:Phosphopantetheine adenylyltransferase n=1 Tax=Candidatus Zymogenus saltonus TaxID=2844893 RepID=A0A9D8KF07_9DELT|nr:pantetheine-phosphate adenylyltransferase [Candidatus Zymogenus saltonus]
MPSLAVLAGTFDPITMGHVDLAERALTVFDKVIMAIGINPYKETLFTVKERIEMIKEALKDYDDSVVVDSFEGLLVDYAEKVNARAIIRGLRAVSDFEFELQLALMNRKLNRNIETFFLMTGYRYLYVSSNIIKAAAIAGGPVTDLVPKCVERKLMEKYSKAYESRRK